MQNLEVRKLHRQRGLESMNDVEASGRTRMLRRGLEANDLPGTMAVDGPQGVDLTSRFLGLEAAPTWSMSWMTARGRTSVRTQYVTGDCQWAHQQAVTQTQIKL